MLLEIIAALGITIIFSENAHLDCMSDNKRLQGCYIPYTNTIVLDYDAWNINRTMYHEIGHAIYKKGDEVAIKGYNPPLLRTGYPLEKQGEEHWCDFYAAYKLNPSFSVEYPSLFIYFRDKELKLTNKIMKTEYYSLVI